MKHTKKRPVVRRKPDASRREQYLQVKLTAAEKAALTKNAALAGMDASAYIRSLCCR